MGLREQKKQQTRQAILVTANRLFRENGYENTRVLDIIDPVQISKKTFFNYFPTKEAVLISLAQEWFLRHTTNQGDEITAAEQQGSSPMERLQAKLLSRLDAVIRDKEFVRTLVNHTSFLNPKPGQGAQAISPLATSYHEMLGLIKDAQRQNEIRNDIPAEELNEIFFAARNAAITRWLMNDSEIDLKQQIENVLKVITKGFQAD